MVLERAECIDHQPCNGRRDGAPLHQRCSQEGDSFGFHVARNILISCSKTRELRSTMSAEEIRDIFVLPKDVVLTKGYILRSSKSENAAPQLYRLNKSPAKLKMIKRPTHDLR